METRFVVCPECGGDKFWHGKEGYKHNPTPVVIRGVERKCLACGGTGQIDEQRREWLRTTHFPESVAKGKMTQRLVDDKLADIDKAFVLKYSSSSGSIKEVVARVIEDINQKLLEGERMGAAWASGIRDQLKKALGE